MSGNSEPSPNGGLKAKEALNYFGLREGDLEFKVLSK